MATPSPIPAGRTVPEFSSPTPPSGAWDRISTWAAENKAVVYTIAGIAVVVSGAGVAYYLTDSVCSNHAPLAAKASLTYFIENQHNRTRFAEEAKEGEEKEEG